MNIVKAGKDMSLIRYKGTCCDCKCEIDNVTESELVFTSNYQLFTRCPNTSCKALILVSHYDTLATN